MSNFGCLVKITAGYGPFIHGVVERHKGIIKRMLTKLRKEKFWEFSLEATIALALFAKNSMLDVNGLSLHQRIYGSNPKSGGSEKIPPRFDNANEADIRILKGHLIGVQKARENFVKITEDRLICEKCIEKYVDMKTADRSANWWC